MTGRTEPDAPPRTARRLTGRPTVVPTVVLLVVAALSVVAACSADEDRGDVTAPTTDIVTTTVPATTVTTTTVPGTIVTATTVPGGTAPRTAPRTVLRFADPASVKGWSNVDDTVMGGRSDGDVRWADGALLFSGVVSLENNGGFSSVRSPFDPAIGAAMGDAGELLVDATGDGKTYVLQLRSGSSGQWLHIVRFTTTAGQARTHVLPLDAFEPVGSRLEPRPATPALDPAAVVQLTVYVLDKQAGPFSLALRSVAAR